MLYLKISNAQKSIRFIKRTKYEVNYLTQLRNISQTKDKYINISVGSSYTAIHTTIVVTIGLFFIQVSITQRTKYAKSYCTVNNIVI